MAMGLMMRVHTVDDALDHWAGADHAHLAAKHVPELWQLIDMGRADK